MNQRRPAPLPRTPPGFFTWDLWASIAINLSIIASQLWAAWEYRDEDGWLAVFVACTLVIVYSFSKYLRTRVLMWRQWQRHRAKAKVIWDSFDELQQCPKERRQDAPGE